MKDKGFTLIELLAVIVILAIIALIAVPIILDIIGDTKNKANKRSIELYGKSIELAIARKSLTSEVPKGSYKTNGNTLTLEDSDFSLDIEYDGARVECDFVQIHDDMTIALDDCKVDGEKINYLYGDNYIDLEYLESTGTQYINTEFGNNADKSLIRIKYEAELFQAEGGWAVSGVGGGPRTYIGVNSGSHTIYYGGDGSHRDVNTGVKYSNEKTIFDVDYKNRKAVVTNSITNEKIYNNSISDADSSGKTYPNLILFGFYSHYSKGMQLHNGRYYNCQIYYDDILVRDFIPVLDKDGIPCMYDKVEKKFYYNQGTGDFKYKTLD